MFVEMNCERRNRNILGKKGREKKGREGDPKGKFFSPLGKKSAAPRKRGKNSNGRGAHEESSLHLRRGLTIQTL